MVFVALCWHCDARLTSRFDDTTIVRSYACRTYFVPRREVLHKCLRSFARQVETATCQRPNDNELLWRSDVITAFLSRTTACQRKCRPTIYAISPCLPPHSTICHHTSAGLAHHHTFFSVPRSAVRRTPVVLLLIRLIQLISRR